MKKHKPIIAGTNADHEPETDSEANNPARSKATDFVLTEQGFLVPGGNFAQPTRVLELYKFTALEKH